MPTFGHDKRDFLLATAATVVGTSLIARTGAAGAQGAARGDRVGAGVAGGAPAPDSRG